MSIKNHAINKPNKVCVRTCRTFAIDPRNSVLLVQDMDISMLIIIACWAVFSGMVFASIGAAGGILTSFGLITIVGIADPNAVKPMTQIIVLATALIFVPTYFKRGNLVWPLGLLLGLGGLVGAWAGSTLSSAYLSDMTTFRPWFGVMTLLVAARIGWDLLRKPAPATGLERDFHSTGVNDLAFKKARLCFTYARKDYCVRAWVPILAGLIISMIASIFGVGGGFLLVPFLASFLKLPMHIIPATAAIAIIMSLLVSISNYLRLGAELNYTILAAMLAGTIVGALLGSFINRNLKDQWLQIGLGAIVLLIGLKYILG